jgi:hypothetical protein
MEHLETVNTSFTQLTTLLRSPLGRAPIARLAATTTTTSTKTSRSKEPRPSGQPRCVDSADRPLDRLRRPPGHQRDVSERRRLTCSPTEEDGSASCLGRRPQQPSALDPIGRGCFTPWASCAGRSSMYCLSRNGDFGRRCFFFICFSGDRGWIRGRPRALRFVVVPRPDEPSAAMTATLDQMGLRDVQVWSRLSDSRRLRNSPTAVGCDERSH